MVKYETWRDDGSTDGATISTTIGANKELEIDSYDDDGYGNGERKTSTLERFVIKANGTVIYNAADYPDDGAIYNGYQINRTDIKDNPFIELNQRLLPNDKGRSLFLCQIYYFLLER